VAKRAHPKRGKKPARSPAAAAADVLKEARPKPEPKPASLPPAKVVSATAPRGWWWLEMPWAKLVAFRFVFFGLMAIDAFLQLPHASRYGAGGFDVPHFSWLPLPEPGRASITFAHGALCVLFALVAQGALVRVALPLATALYGWAYFSSQLDSYQHHYLMWLLLVILCFAPRAPGPLPAGASPGAPRTTRSWAVRLALVQVAIVYLWAAISKIDSLWLDGSALFIQVKDGWVRGVVEAIGFDRVAVMVMAGELFLAAAVWNRKLWLPALAVGVGLHVGIELVGLEIGLFSHLMFAVYLLLVPDAVFTRAAAVTAPRVRALGEKLPPVLRHAAWPAAVASLVATFVLVPLPLGAAITLVAVLLAAGAAISRDTRVGWAFAVAALVPIVVHAETDVADDYYRYWAGSARRLGNDQEARRAYAGLLEVDPSSEYAHYYLGKQDADAGNLDAALAHFEAAERSMPTRGRSFFAEAEVHLRRNDPARARTALAAGLAVEDNPQARQLLTSLGGTTQHPPDPTTGPSSDDD
jgi:hypothetical protein